MKHKILTLVSLILFLLGIISGFGNGIASAAFNSSVVIDDPTFNASGSMSTSQIDSFLNGFSTSCISPSSGFQARIPSGYSPSGGFTFGGYTTAGVVIQTSAKVFGINPRVLLVTLEKEQNLITGRNSSSYCLPSNDNNHKYAAAMGYGCPDSGTKYNYTGLDLYKRNGTVQSSAGPTCVNSAQKAGFSQQVIRAAWLLKFGQQRSLGNVSWAVISGSWNNSDDPLTCYGGPMTHGTHKRCSDGTAVYYDGYQTIDNTATYMGSGATAAMYWYTPHFHGNQLFVDTYNSWFGSTIAKCTSADKIGSDVYRLFSTKTGRHYYTAFVCEANSLDVLSSYKLEGVAFIQVPSTLVGRVAAFRLRNSHTGNRFWTSDTNEVNYLSKHGYIVEGPAFTVFNSSNAYGNPVYRLFNSVTGAHFWTSSTNERNNIVKNPSWRYEGIAYYVYNGV